MSRHLLPLAAHAARLLPPDATLCYGVRCPRHGACARYLAVDGSRGQAFMGSCVTAGRFPLFVDAHHTPPEKGPQ